MVQPRPVSGQFCKIYLNYFNYKFSKCTYNLTFCATIDFVYLFIMHLLWLNDWYEVNWVLLYFILNLVL